MMKTNPTRWFRPARPAIDAARAFAADRTTDPAILWAQLVEAGLVRASARRTFLHYGEKVDCARCGGEGQVLNFDPTDCLGCSARGSVREVVRRERPATIDECVAFAADGQAIEQVEALADEVAAGMGAWRKIAYEEPARPFVWISLPEPLDGVDRAPLSTDPYYALFDDRSLSSALGLAYHRVSSEARRAEGLLVGDGSPHPAVVKSMSRREAPGETINGVLRAASLYAMIKPNLPDVFTPLGKILDLGYVLNTVTDDRIELLAPRLDLG